VVADHRPVGDYTHDPARAKIARLVDQ
jgi:hypothetical protein